MCIDPQWSEHPAEVFTSAVEARLDGADFSFNERRDVGEWQLVILRENDDLSLQRWQRAHGAADDLADLRLFDIQWRRDEAIFVKFVPASLVAPPLEQQVARDAEQ